MSQTEDEMRAELERLRTENEELKTRKSKELRLQVSAKGGVSLYGVRRFPVTFYADEWDTLLEMGDKIRAFIREHDTELKRKG
jgi:hypothetical protein